MRSGSGGRWIIWVLERLCNVNLVQATSEGLMRIFGGMNGTAREGEVLLVLSWVAGRGLWVMSLCFPCYLCIHRDCRELRIVHPTWNEVQICLFIWYGHASKLDKTL